MGDPRRVLALTAVLLVSHACLARAQEYEVPEEALRAAARSLVVVRCRGTMMNDGPGLGFAYGRRDRVLTVPGRATCRDELYVTTVDGARIVVERSRIDRELGIAQLELAQPLPASVVPLEPTSFEDPARGEPLALFRYAWDHREYESPFGLERAAVTATDPVRFERLWDSGGSPVLNREGALIGMTHLSWDFDDVRCMVHLDDIRRFVAAPPDAVPARAHTWWGTSVTLAAGFGDGDLFSFGDVVNVTASLADRFTLTGELSGHALMHLDDHSDEAPVGVRVASGFRVGLRLPAYFDDGFTFVFLAEIGGAWGYDYVPPPPGETEFTHRFWIRPVARATVRLSMCEIGYELQLDPLQPERSTHTIHLGIAIE